ncbi:hypothetical protein Pla52o_29990 [Novipirellula galeiformis]|uniref:Uncharacterized protein n=1 Tax=Novipirellula galeiformis TaxID=2528004 RepID=A0A5C6CEZ4_9BACT|nr:hypothetical protein [Novipirellula galeiformis]TWU23463.1 hypothetical protein Pla52o_29990 [Novipirellula galeiformis]
MSSTETTDSNSRPNILPMPIHDPPHRADDDPQSMAVEETLFFV